MAIVATEAIPISADDCCSASCSSDSGSSDSDTTKTKASTEANWQPSAAAGGLNCFFSRRSIFAVLCATAFFAVVSNLGVEAEDHFDAAELAALPDEYATLPAPSISRAMPDAAPKVETPAMLPETEVKSDYAPVAELGLDAEEADAYTARGVMQDLRSVLSFALGVVVCSMTMKRDGRDGSASSHASRELRMRRQERREARQAAAAARLAVASSSDSDSEGEGSVSESESEDESENQMKKVKLYLYMM